MTTKPISILDLKKYFGETSSSKFAAEWRELSPEDKQWFKDALAELNKNN